VPPAADVIAAKDLQCRSNGGLRDKTVFDDIIHSACDDGTPGSGTRLQGKSLAMRLPEVLRPSVAFLRSIT